MGFDMLEGLRGIIIALFVICCITVPLGIWKLIDIIIWAFHHISIHTY